MSPIRIIPARAGFTEGQPVIWGTEGDHPRACGVYVCLFTRTTAANRIIPARAGFTSRAGPGGNWDTDHPRACGVYRDEDHLIIAALGSSPRVRGLPLVAWRAGFRRRIIPARAGFTLTRTRLPDRC